MARLRAEGAAALKDPPPGVGHQGGETRYIYLVLFIRYLLGKFVWLPPQQKSKFMS
jgi:hypothetical protein